MQNYDKHYLYFYKHYGCNFFYCTFMEFIMSWVLEKIDWKRVLEWRLKNHTFVASVHFLTRSPMEAEYIKKMQVPSY